jgi:hypothetical protein
MTNPQPQGPIREPLIDDGLIIDTYDDMLEIEWSAPGHPELMARQLVDESLRYFRRCFTGDPQYMYDKQLKIEEANVKLEQSRSERIANEREQLREKQARVNRARLRGQPGGAADPLPPAPARPSRGIKRGLGH